MLTCKRVDIYRAGKIYDETETRLEQQQREIDELKRLMKKK